MNPLPEFLTTRRPLTILLVIMALSAAVRIYLFRGYVGLDDGEYARLAYQLAHGEFSLGEYAGPAVFPLRVGLIAPTAAVFGLFGFGEKLMVSFPLFLSLLSLPLAYLCASTLFGRGAGLISAGILGTLPADIAQATYLCPDLPAAVLAAAGVTVILHLSREGSRQGSALFLGGGLAGLLFGFSWLCKETIAYLAPFILLLIILTMKKRGRGWLPLWVGATAGAVGVLLAEVAVYQALTGDLLFRFHEVERAYAQLENGFFSEGSDWGWQVGESRTVALLRRLFLTGPAFLLWNDGISYLPVLGLIGVLYGWLRRDRSFLIPSLWLVTLLLMFNFGSSSTSTYTPLALFTRYLHPLLFPSALLAGGLIAKQVHAGFGSLRRREIPFGQGTGVLAVGIILWTVARPLCWSLRDPDHLWWTEEVRELSHQIGPDTPLYSDTLSLRGFEFFGGYPKENRWTDFQRVQSANEVEPGSLVLINPRYLEWLERNRGMWLSRREGYQTHAFFDTPPSSWVEVWENDNASLFRVDTPKPSG